MEAETKEKNKKIIGILASDGIKSDDVTELMHISMAVDAILNKIIIKKIVPSQSLSYRIFQRGLQKLDSVIVDYFSEIQKVFLSLFTSIDKNFSYIRPENSKKY